MSNRASLRDHQPEEALYYQALAEQVAARKLGNQTEISWAEAKYIVRIVADMIGEQAQVTAKFLAMDLPTGKPLLPKNA